MLAPLMCSAGRGVGGLTVNSPGGLQLLAETRDARVADDGSIERVDALPREAGGVARLADEPDRQAAQQHTYNNTDTTTLTCTTTRQAGGVTRLADEPDRQAAQQGEQGRSFQIVLIKMQVAYLYYNSPYGFCLSLSLCCLFGVFTDRVLSRSLCEMS